MQIHYPDSSRIGKFRILAGALADGANRPMLQALFALCVVLHMEDDDTGRGKMYYAASELFQEIKDGDEIPEYRIDYAENRPFPNPEHEARRRESSGGFAFVATRQNILRVPAAQLRLLVRDPRQSMH